MGLTWSTILNTPTILPIRYQRRIDMSKKISHHWRRRYSNHMSSIPPSPLYYSSRWRRYLTIKTTSPEKSGIVCDAEGD